MKKKNLSILKLSKRKISNLNILSSQFGGNITGETDTFTAGSETNPNNSIVCYTVYCGETETCETKCGGCNTNGNTKTDSPPSVEVACNAIGTFFGC
jgi:hypothetical protein